MKSRFLLALALLLAASPASGHSWYPSDCCADKDCHPAACDDIRKDGSGFAWFDLELHQWISFKREQMKPSQDDGCHVCVLSWTGICIFLPWRS